MKEAQRRLETTELHSVDPGIRLLLVTPSIPSGVQITADGGRRVSGPQLFPPPNPYPTPPLCNRLCGGRSLKDKQRDISLESDTLFLLAFMFLLIFLSTVDMHPDDP